MQIQSHSQIEKASSSVVEFVFHKRVRKRKQKYWQLRFRKRRVSQLTECRKASAAQALLWSTDGLSDYRRRRRSKPAASFPTCSRLANQGVADIGTARAATTGAAKFYCLRCFKRTGHLDGFRRVPDIDRAR